MAKKRGFARKSHKPSGKDRVGYEMRGKRK